MTIAESQFDSEAELQGWATANLSKFLGECLYLPSFRITTPSGKHGIPDGFAFNLVDRTWCCIECETLNHGVWPHIAEQITRFVVALQNPTTLRIIRDKLFEQIISDNRAAELSTALNCGIDRLLQQIELFIEGTPPSIVIFIDDTNQDLVDFCNALDTPTDVFRIKKFIVNGTPDYYSPDENRPALTTSPSGDNRGAMKDFEIIEQTGGGTVVSETGRIRCYDLSDGKRVHIKKSKFYERHQVYWYGINPSSHDKLKQSECTHYIFALENDGMVVVPIDIIEEFLVTANTSQDSQGAIRHYHLEISPPPDVSLKRYGNSDDVSVAKYFRAFD